MTTVLSYYYKEGMRNDLNVRGTNSRGIENTSLENRFGQNPILAQNVGVQPNPAWQTFQATTYYNVNINAGRVPILASNGNVIGRVTGRGFVDAAMEGSAHLQDGTQVNVDHFIAAPSPAEYADAVAAARLAYAGNNRNNQPLTTRNVGLVIPGRINNRDINPATDTVSRVLAFRVTRRAEGVRGGLTPYYSIAVPTTIPIGTRILIRELQNRVLPNGTIHNGWVTADDHGGNIRGNRLDFFADEQHPNFLSGTVHVSW
jgi:3D (Asp-Asp-Asp) domain-containing protein